MIDNILVFYIYTCIYIYILFFFFFASLALLLTKTWVPHLSHRQVLHVPFSMIPKWFGSLGIGWFNKKFTKNHGRRATWDLGWGTFWGLKNLQRLGKTSVLNEWEMMCVLFLLSYRIKKESLQNARWWQLKYFWNFHPENWGRFPIWGSYFSNGLVQPPTRNVVVSCSLVLFVSVS